MGKENKPLKQIRTFQGDVAEALGKQQESLVSIQRAEQARKEVTKSLTEAEEKSGSTKKQFFLLLLSSLLLFTLSVAGIWYAYKAFVEKTATPIPVAPANRFISPSSEFSINFTSIPRETFIASLNKATSDLSNGEIRHIVLKKTLGDEESLLPISKFLETLDSRAPGSLVRAFESDFMLGAINNGATSSTFLIIKLSSFENAFAGMLLWEKDMRADIGSIFSTADILKELPTDSVFVDITDKNKDIRSITFNNKPVLLYSFLDSKILIITDSLETLRTVVERLTQERLSH